MAITTNCNDPMKKKMCLPLFDLVVLLVALPLFVYAAFKLESFMEDMATQPEKRWYAFALGFLLLVAGITVCGYITHRMGVCLWAGPIDEAGNPANSRSRRCRRFDRDCQAVYEHNIATTVPPPNYDTAVQMDPPPPSYDSLAVHLQEYFQRHGTGQPKPEPQPQPQPDYIDPRPGTSTQVAVVHDYRRDRYDMPPMPPHYDELHEIIHV